MVSKLKQTMRAYRAGTLGAPAAVPTPPRAQQADKTVRGPGRGALGTPDGRADSRPVLELKGYVELDFGIEKVRVFSRACPRCASI